MGFLDWLFGAPTMDKLARDVTRALHERDAQEPQVDLARREMTFRRADHHRRLKPRRDSRQCQTSPCHLTRTPPLMTASGCSSSRMSVNGSPLTATKSP